MSQDPEPELNLLDNAPVAFYSCDLKGNITHFNQAAVELWGQSPQPGKAHWCGGWKSYNLNGKPFLPAEHPAAKAILEQSFDHKTEIRIERPDHSFKTILIQPQAQYDAKGKLTGAYFFLTDTGEFLTDHIKQATLSAIVESSEDAIISKNLDGIITSWNLGAERILGYSEKEAIGKHITMIIPESRLDEEKQIIAKLKKGERIHHFETYRLTKAGKLIPLSLSISPIRDANGKVVGASKVARDISERLRSFEKQAMLSAIVESSDDAIISKNLDGIITSWNRGAQMIFGYSEEEVLGRSITMLIPKEKLQEETTILGKIRKGEKIDHFETQRRHKSGREISVSITVSPVKDHKGNIVGASKVARDITPQVRSQKALQKYTRNLEILNSVNRSISENLNFKEILKHVTDITTELTRADFGIFFYEIQNSKETNTNHYAVSGELKEQITKKLKVSRFKNLIPKSSLNTVFLIEDIKKQGGNCDSFYTQLHKELGFKSFMAVPLISKKGLIIGGFLFGHSREEHFKNDDKLLVRNITAQTAVSLQNSYLFERVKSLSEKKDQFIALASHELRTPLTSIKGYIQLVSKLMTNEKADFFIDKSLVQVEKLNKLIEDLLNMSRLENGKLELQLAEFDLKDILEDVINTFNYSYQSHRIEAYLGDEPIILTGDPQRIEQVIINLISNAIKYSPHADRVQVSLEQNDQEVGVKVRDYGIGLEKECQKKLFERFYRADNSKGISGLGIGLYLSRQIIDLHQGEIGVESEPGEGSEFYFSLPKNHNLTEKTKLEDKIPSPEL